MKFNIIKKFLIVLWTVFYLILLCGALGSYYGAGALVVFDYFSLIPQYVYIIFALLMAVFALFLFGGIRKKIIATLLVATVIGYAMPLLDVVWSNEYPQNKTPIYKVFSWNTARWDASRQQDFFRIMKENESDFYLLQEVQYRKNRWVYYDVLQEFKGYFAAHFGEYMLLSRFPLKCNPPSELCGYLYCVADTPNGSVGLFSVHLKRPFHVTDFRSFEDFKVRKWQFDEMMTAVHGSSDNVIIAGDFNSTANYPFIRTLSHQFEKNNPRGRFVFPHTFPADNPQFRIDYQFVSSEYTFCGYKELEYPELSDHIGIVGDICLLVAESVDGG